MGKTRNTGKLATQIQFDNSNNLVIGNSASSSFNTSGSVNAIGGITGSIFGIGNPTSFSSSISSNLVSIQSVTASNIARLSNLETKSSSVDISVSSINLVTASLNSKTGSYATTGSNTFVGTQIVSASMYVQGDFVVYGSSSIQYISASSVSIGTNIVNLNTANPVVRFGGLSIIDSGSASGKSGSFLFDSRDNEWVFLHQGTTTVTSSTMITGPETYNNLGEETHLTDNVIPKSLNGFHIYDSCIFDNGTTTCIKNNLIGTGTACFAGNVCAPVAVFTGCVGIGLGAAAQTALEVNGGNTYFPSKIITISGAENTRYNGFMGLNLIGGSQIGMSLGTRSNNIDYTNTLNLYQGNVGIGTNTTTPTEKLEINVGAGSRLGMAITGEYPYIILNNSGSTSPNARSFALSLTSLEAGDFAIKMANCKNGNPVADGFDPFRISRGGDVTITCSLTIAGCGLIMSGTGALTLPSGTTTQRPGTPSAGMIRYNNATNTTEYYNGCGWYAFSDNYVHGVDMLMVSAGGGGGVNLSGAGGGGGVLYFTNFSLRPGIPITIIVGGGGSPGAQGNASCAFGNVLCGGQGASQVTFHRSGNSGFLASLANSNCYTSVAVYCNNLGGYASGNAGAGGAGAGSPGTDMCGNSESAWRAKPGACGAQVGTILDGVNNYYWAGGGGGEGYGDYGGAGGCGGGGGGGVFSAYGTQFYPGCGGLGGLNPGCPGTVTNSPLNGGTGGANTGGGGGGGSHTGAGQTSATGGNGGSGIVILRYPQNYNPPTVTGTTPCICTYCGYRSYIFLSSGTITF